MAQARAARLRATPSRSSRGAALSGSGGSARTPKSSGSARQDVASSPAGEASEYEKVLDLQQFAGNQAVVQLLATGGAPAGGPPPAGFPGAGNRAISGVLAPWVQASTAIQRKTAGDSDPKFRVQKLRHAINFEMYSYRYVINLEEATEALSNLTAADGRMVIEQFQEIEKVNLGYVLSGTQSPRPGLPPAPNNLAQADRTKLQYMLLGTASKPTEAPTPPTALTGSAGPSGLVSVSGGAAVLPAPTGASAAPAPDPDAERAAENRLRVVAAGIRTAVGKKDVATAIALIPATMQERRDVDTVYKALYGETAYMALFTKLPGKQGQRAAALWYDERDDADRLALEAASDERDKANKEAAEIDKMPMLAPMAKARRKEGQEKVEAAVKQVSQAGDQSSVAGREAGKARLRKALNDPKAGLAKKIDITSDGITKAIAEGDEAAELAGRLARDDETTDVTPAEVESTLRSLRELAMDAADREIDVDPEKLEPQAAQITKNKIDDYYARFVESFNKQQKRRSFDLVVTGHGGTDEKAAKFVGVSVDDLREVAGKSSDVSRNKQLLAKKGELPEWQEVFYALNRDPKDIERVRSILGSKTYTEIQALANDYMINTGLRSLEVDLAGTDAEQTFAKIMGGEVRENLQDRRSMLGGGKFDRDAAEGRVPGALVGDQREAHLLKAEGAFLSGRITALERRVIENRGYFAQVRDWSGNEEKSILDLASKDAIRASSGLANALTPDQGATWKPGEEGKLRGPNIDEAKRQVAELRRIESRMNHAVSIYKEATKKAYEEFVDLVVNAATIAAGLGVTGIWITALRTTAATVGTKLLMKGNDYSVDEFIGDVQGGMAGVAGDFAKLGFKQFVAPYVVSKIIRNARRVGMSKAFIAKVQAQVGPLAMRQAEHTIGTGVGNVTQGNSWTEGQGFGDRVKGEVIGTVTAPIDEKIKVGKAKAAAEKAKRADGAGADPDAEPRRIADGNESRNRAAAGATEMGDAPVGRSGADAGETKTTAVVADAVEETSPKTSMALPEPPRARPTKRDDEAARHASPQTEPRTAKLKARPDGGAVAASPGEEYPSGATQLNTKVGPPPIPGALPTPSADELKPRPRSEAFRRKADQELAEVGRTMAAVRDNPKGTDVRNMVEGDLRIAQHAWALAHGHAAPTADEFHRLNAEERLADVESEYADVLGLPGSPRRVAAEEQVIAAGAGRARAADAVQRAETEVRRATAEAPDSPLLKAAQSNLDAAAAALHAAEVELKRAKGEQTKATVGLARGDWRRRRAEIAMHGAKRDVEKAHRRPEPEDTVGPASKRPIQGPPERFPPHLWDQELVIQLKNPHSLHEAQGLVVKMLHEDPTREVGLFRNTETGEYIVVRGKETRVTVETGPGGEAGPRGKGMAQRWKELLGADGDVGNWELVVHTHPSEFGMPIDPLNRYPSSGKGDFGVIHDDSESAGGQPRQSEIWYFDGIRMQRTQFGVDFGHDDAYWIQLPGQDKVRFFDIYAYQRYLAKEMAPFGITPKFLPPPPMRVGDAGATASGSTVHQGAGPVAESPAAKGVETADGGVGTAVPGVGNAKGAATAEAGVDSREQARQSPARTTKVSDPNADIAGGPVAPSVPRTDVYTQHDWGDYVVLERPQEGLSESYRLRHRGTGKIYIFKPTKGEQSVPRAEERGIRKGEQAPRTKATELTAGRLGIETPNVDLVRLGTRPGSMTEWIGLNSLGRLEKSDNAEFQRIVKSEEFRKLRATVDALDYLTNNLDRNRNYGNYLFELGPDGKVIRVVPIDHDLTFTSTVGRANLEAYTRPLPDTYTPDMVDKLVRLSADRQAFIDEITPLVGKEAIPGVLHRLDILLNDAQLKQPAAFTRALDRR